MNEYMNINRKLCAAIALGIALTLSACGGGGGGNDDDLRGDGVNVPADASRNSSNFVDYVGSLSATDETSPPLLLGDSFVVPDDETGAPLPLT